MSIPTLVLTHGAEGGWCSVLSYAHQRGLQFGPDIVHAYGPLGFLIIPQFAPQVPLLRMAVDVALSFGVAAAVCLLAWRLEIWWRALVIFVFTLLTANIEYAPQDLLINLGLLSWGMLCVLESRPRLGIYTTLLVMLAVFSALAKFSCLILASATIGIVAVDLFVRGKRWLGLASATIFLLGVVGLWMVLGQALSNLAVFMARGLATSTGYAQTMALKPSASVLSGGVLVAGLMAALAIIRCTAGVKWRDQRLRFRRLLLLIWLLSILFLTWKHGFLRADSHHIALFLGFATMMILLLQVLPCEAPKARKWSRGLAWTGCILSLFTLQTALAPEYLHLDQPFRRAAFNARALFNPTAYVECMNQALSQEKRVVNLPGLRQIIGPASVDAFGNYQSYAVLNEFNYRPRPVFQSYTAYTEPLMRLNEEFYASKLAPDFVLARLSAIDDRFPPLEDALVFRHLLMNYALAGNEGQFLLLKAKPIATPRLSLLREGAVLPGEPIGLESFGNSDIWLEIDVNPTLAGRIWSFLYQPSETRLLVYGASPGVRPLSFRAPAPMLAVGFMASPLLTNNNQLLDFYQGKPLTRPSSYSVGLGAAGKFNWKSDVHFRVYSIEPALSRPPH